MLYMIINVYIFVSVFKYMYWSKAKSNKSDERGVSHVKGDGRGGVWGVSDVHGDGRGVRGVSDVQGHGRG